jgi:hypothetical protein
MMRIKARFDSLQFQKAAEHQTASDEQHKRKSHFCNHYDILKQPAAAKSGVTAARSQYMHHIRARGAQRGHHSENCRCRQTCQRRERHHHGIDLDGIQTWQIRRRDDQQLMDARPSQTQPQDRSHCREQQSLRQHLTY